MDKACLPALHWVGGQRKGRKAVPGAWWCYVNVHRDESIRSPWVSGPVLSFVLRAPRIVCFCEESQKGPKGRRAGEGRMLRKLLLVTLYFLR